jgi:hypothetical protein
VILLQVDPASNDQLETVCEGCYETEDTYTYDLRTMLVVRGAGGCLTTKKGPWCGAVLVRCEAVFVDLFHFLLLFVTFFIARNFYKLFFTAETGVKFVTFCYCL